jgi:hypothetical protein
VPVKIVVHPDVAVFAELVDATVGTVLLGDV